MVFLITKILDLACVGNLGKFGARLVTVYYGIDTVYKGRDSVPEMSQMTPGFAVIIISDECFYRSTRDLTVCMFHLNTADRLCCMFFQSLKKSFFYQRPLDKHPLGAATRQESFLLPQEGGGQTSHPSFIRRCLDRSPQQPWVRLRTS